PRAGHPTGPATATSTTTNWKPPSVKCGTWARRSGRMMTSWGRTGDRAPPGPGRHTCSDRALAGASLRPRTRRRIGNGHRRRSGKTAEQSQVNRQRQRNDSSIALAPQQQLEQQPGERERGCSPQTEARGRDEPLPARERPRNAPDEGKREQGEVQEIFVVV